MKVELISADGKDRCKVELAGVTVTAYTEVSNLLYQSLAPKPRQAYKHVATAMRRAVATCPEANPADLWVHLIYHQFRNRLCRSDQSWKRVSGDAFEQVLISIYNDRLRPYGVQMRKSTGNDAKILRLQEQGIGSSKTDIVVETTYGLVFGVLHCKASIAERLTDDVPASTFLMQNGYWSGMATMDAKMFPPPHGDGIVRGELGVTRTSDKRNYFEIAGQFSGCYSFNTRTQPSSEITPSGKKIYALSLSESQPDQLVTDICAANFYNKK